jgi:anthranilate synthase component 2
VRNDELTAEEALALRPERIVISPGPGTPDQSGITLELIRRRRAASRCWESAWAPGPGPGLRRAVVRAPTLMHGKTSPIHHDGRTVFAGLPDPFIATRYHSLIVDRDSVPECLEVSAWTADGIVMGLRHRGLPWRACSSIPRASSPPRARTCCGTSCAWGRPAAAQRAS